MLFRSLIVDDGSDTGTELTAISCLLIVDDGTGLMAVLSLLLFGSVWFEVGMC